MTKNVSLQIEEDDGSGHDLSSNMTTRPSTTPTTGKLGKFVLENGRSDSSTIVTPDESETTEELICSHFVCINGTARGRSESLKIACSDNEMSQNCKMFKIEYLIENR